MMAQSKNIRSDAIIAFNSVKKEKLKNRHGSMD
jgi:hypothetical protein